MSRDVPGVTDAHRTMFAVEAVDRVSGRDLVRTSSRSRRRKAAGPEEEDCRESGPTVLPVHRGSPALPR